MASNGMKNGNCVKILWLGSIEGPSDDTKKQLREIASSYKFSIPWSKLLRETFFSFEALVEQKGPLNYCNRFLLATGASCVYFDVISHCQRALLRLLMARFHGGHQGLPYVWVT